MIARSHVVASAAFTLALALPLSAAAQTLWDEPGQLDAHLAADLAERAWLEERLTVPTIEGWGVDAEYEGMDVSDVRADRDGPAAVTTAPVDMPWDDSPPTDLSFDISAITDLPFDLQRVDHPVLLEFLEYYATEGRGRATRWLSSSGRYRDAILAEIEAQEAPIDLIWVAAIESGFDDEAVSHAGAVGMWQFMERTAVGRGMRIDRWVDERRDPAIATRYAVAYLVDRYERFGSWPIALAAYNAGAGHVRGELREHNVTDFWVMDRYGCLYSDARRYALRIITIAIIARNPAAFGMEGVVADPGRTWDEVEVDGGLRLSLVAEAVGSDVDELQALNPALRRPQTPPDVERWTLRIPAGTRDTFVRRFDDLESRYGGEHELVTLRFGETVAAVAERTGISERVLRAINDLGRYERAAYGTDLIVPLEGRDPPRRDNDDEDAEPPVIVLPQTRFAFADRRRVFYEVNTGDTPAEIAEHFGVGLYELAAWNDIDPRAALWSGMVLQVWVAPDADLADSVVLTDDDVRAVALNSPEYEALQAESVQAQQRRRRTHTVGAGDTVIRIARRYGVRTSDIIRWNDLDDDGMIVIGQDLVVGR